MRVKIENSFFSNRIYWRFFRWIGLMIIFLFSTNASPVFGADCDINGDGGIDEADVQLCLELYLNVCPTTFAISCSELSCDINGDGETTPADAQQISWHYLGRESLCEDMTPCKQCRSKQDRAKDALNIIMMGMEAYFAENDYLPSSLEELSIMLDDTANYTYEIQSSFNEDAWEYQATARSKSPGIMDGGEADDIWISTAANSTLTVTNEKDGCGPCPPDPREPCGRCRDRQIEAKRSLGTIAKGQEAYFAEFGTHADTLEKIGFILRGDPLYRYSLSNVSDSTFLATASSVEPGIMNGGAGDDVWTIDHQREIRHLVDACPYSGCSDCTESQEAMKRSLLAIAKNQEAHLLEHGRLADSLEQLGYLSSGYLARYAYQYTKTSGGEYTVTATSKPPGIMNGGEGDDKWSIDQNFELIHLRDACSFCMADAKDCNICRSLQTLSVNKMSLIRDKLLAFYQSNGFYADSLSEIGYEVNPYDRHTYTISSDNSSSTKTFLITAQSKEPGIMTWGAGDNIWTMDQDGRLEMVLNPCPNCPRDEVFFPGYECKRRQSEAKQALGTITKEQEIYRLENGAYADSIEQLGFQESNPEQSRYEYSISLFGPTSYTAIATSRFPGIWNGGVGDDIWTTDRNRLFRNPVNGCDW
ncbi:MAG: type IV pilin-like G/H family protein [Desulfococcaceae bacterium]